VLSEVGGRIDHLRALVDARAANLVRSRHVR
jgi:hypothetical protein